ncbi:hypothetical protein [Streptomyces sp. NBC_01615]|uniref:hypothetical protein n=1 Tax=Streptomyces sp. NBC_01615 TaxID=2975898 RepID=UPI00386E7E7F
MGEEVRIEVGRDVAGQIAVGHHLIQLSGAHSSVTLIQQEQLPRPVPREDKKGPVSVDPEGELPHGTKILYWGCQEGAAASSCTVVADRAKTVCVSSGS